MQGLTVASSKTEMVHAEKLTTKGGKYVLSLEIISTGDLLK